MVEDMTTLDKNDAWDLVQILVEIKLIGSKCVFENQKKEEGKVEKYKAWLVVKGYSQVSGIDFGFLIGSKNYDYGLEKNALEP